MTDLMDMPVEEFNEVIDATYDTQILESILVGMIKNTVQLETKTPEGESVMAIAAVIKKDFENHLAEAEAGSLDTDRKILFYQEQVKTCFRELKKVVVR